MGFSIAKLESLLDMKGFSVIRYYVMDGMCFFIEIFANKTSDVCLLYIPSKYNFKLDESTKNAYEISYIDINSDDTADQYANDDEVKDEYKNINIQLAVNGNDLEQQLKDNYKNEISLSKYSGDDIVSIKSLYRQLKRLSYCVENINYKVGILYKNFICAIRRNNSVDCFSVKNFHSSATKKLMIIVDLETFYEKNDQLIYDINTVRSNMYSVLEKNQGVHSVVIEKMIENRGNIISIPKVALQKSIEYDTMLKKLNGMLNTILESERREYDELHNIDNSESIGNFGLSNDFSSIQRRSGIQHKLDKINELKDEIYKLILLVRMKKENSILSLDIIMFDNAVMFNRMLNNFSLMKSIII